MRRTFLFYLSLLVVIFEAQAQHYGQQAKVLVQVLEETHCQPRTRDDSFSAQLYDAFLDALDPQGLYFSDQCLQSLVPYRLQLDDALQTGNEEFLKKATALYETRLLQTDSLVQAMLARPLPYAQPDTLTLLGHRSSYRPENEQVHQKLWQKVLRYRIGSRLAERDPTLASFAKREQEMRELVRAQEHCKFQKLLYPPEGLDTHVASLFLNAVANQYDPHTAFFSGADKEGFEASLSREAYTFGFEVEEGPNGEIQVAQLMPGGPAWKSNELHKGDVVLEVQLGKDVVDPVCLTAEALNQQMQSTLADRLDITVRNAGGQLTHVKLIKIKLEVEESVIKSFVLHGPQKIGYISLPDFYTEFDSPTQLGCANDVAKAILKLKKEQITGLILDLRFNGGGSLQEAQALAGIFIDVGPLSILQDRDQKPYLLKDVNRGTIYDGPLLVLVNRFSASASELLAAALQDYNRALIVGQTTYGKASAQTILPLPDVPHAPMGFVKVTIDQLYRITGNSHQQRGVAPDVVLPDLYSYLPMSEKDEAHALSFGHVDKKVYYQPGAALPRETLRERSHKRVEHDTVFTRADEAGQLLARRFSQETAIPLELSHFQKAEAHAQQLINQLETCGRRPTTLFEVEADRYEQELLQMDTHRQELNQAVVDDLRHDAYLTEAYQVLLDFIELQSNK
ncbi:carboxy terminal-processing peptidase [Catalinimonas alkaloidigena]|nr:carboxy terminal-processing peptidase [Catalinimonas alkaloidigena]